MCSQVPNELWLEIFSDLSPDALKDVSVTNRTFCHTTRRLLFAHFDFHPYAIGPHSAPILPSDLDVARYLERLDFWTSDEIAPFVCSCTITPTRRASPFDTVKVSPGPYVLLEPFFERIVRFTGLQRLMAKHAHFNAVALGNLRRMPSLTHLQIDHFEITAGESMDFILQPLSLTRFSVSHNVTREDGLEHWIPLLNPEHLRELNIMCNLRILGESTDAIPIFPRLQKLSLFLNLATMSRNLATMSKFPGVRVVTIEGWGEVDSWPDLHTQQGVFPLLTEYIGTYKILPLFFHRATLTRITITGATPEILIARLQGLRTPLNITAVTASFHRFDGNFGSFDTAVLSTLFDVLPRLTEFCLRITLELEDDDLEDDANPIATSFFEALAHTPVLPPTLQRLALSWEFEYHDLECEPTVNDPPDLPRLRDVLTERCPRLQSLWLDGHDFLLQWRKAIDGICVEASADNAAEVASMRKDFAKWWEMR
ncbi:L-aminoadipate-semialdehyde dehydrogenase [Mycena venus]|uniref:L-aminoadipate-semialdehyde dehydrogenase n=1 Tax=Mycena venus TaxID=2733690 RepID=A0A8H6XPB0_9AGAR|nr:L-aminoadipate-semialdehyde dehydrogenase [Mycena venus]